MAVETLTIELELRDLRLHKYVKCGCRLFDPFFHRDGHPLE